VVMASRSRFWKVSNGYEVVREDYPHDRDPYMRVYTVVRVGCTEQTEVRVEFGVPRGVRPSKYSALIAVRPYLERDERPPRRLVVQCDRTVAEFDE
jgi:hypothetical protein